MTWLLWRQHRMWLALAAVLTAAFGIPAAVTGTRLATKLIQCRASNTCGEFDILQGYNTMRVIVNLTIAVPLIIGAFWGATIVGRELETGTAALVWTQSVTRRRWLSGKLATLFVASAAFSGAVAALVTWWSNPANATLESRFDGAQFDIQGIVPVAYTLFAVALALAAGVVLRRTVPAMATTLGGFVAVRLLVELVARPHYMAPITKTTGFTKGPSADVGSGSSVLSQDLLHHGQVILGPVPGSPCVNAKSAEAMGSCMQRLGYQLRTVYQPAGRYWTFQWIEFGIFAGLAVMLVAVAVIVLRRRDA